MKPSLKGALLSGLVFPGLGQVVLGARKRGGWLMATTMLCLGVIVASATHKALRILDTLAQEGRPLDFESIAEAAARASTTTGTLVFNLFFLVLLGCWLFAIVDAYRFGAGQDE